MHRASLILLLTVAGEALAHPGHGAGGWLSAELPHLLSEPDHLAMILAPLVIGLAWIARRIGTLRARRREGERVTDPRACGKFGG